MYVFIELENVTKVFPEVQDWIDTIKKHIIKTDVSNDKIFCYYSFTSIVPKKYENIENMCYDKRLIYELSLIRTIINLKINNFHMSYRPYDKTIIPVEIVELIKKILQIKISIENKLENESPFDIFKSENIQSDNTQLNIDHILDKISKTGMDMLSEQEKKFLKNYSKNTK